MNTSLLAFVMLVLLSVSFVRSFKIPTRLKSLSKFSVSKDILIPHMGLFDFFGPKKSASASHILVKGSGAKSQLNSLKIKLSSSKTLKDDFAEAAAKLSACPSGKKGGALGTFKQGQMVPAFDKVVFSEEIGVVHGSHKNVIYYLFLFIHRSNNNTIR